MQKIESVKLEKESKIIDALKILDKFQIALIVDSNGFLIGTVTDGDIRRGLLKGKSLDEPIIDIAFKTPIICNINDSKEKLLNIAISKDIKHIPITDNSGKVIGFETFSNLVDKKIRKNRVVLMAGGLGTRLRPLTENIPKPMLKVGNRPILETILENFAKYSFTNFTISLNYLGNIIKEHFLDGRKFGVNINYIEEDKRLGTAGALSLLKDELRASDEPFFVMNGDLLTNINFEHLLDFHNSYNATATMVVREYDFQVPFGVVNIDDGRIKSIVEKPTHKFFVSAGIYLLSKDVLDFIPDNEFFDMPTLFEKLIEANKNVISFPLREYWLDIGRISDFERANSEYFEVFNG